MGLRAVNRITDAPGINRQEAFMYRLTSKLVIYRNIEPDSILFELARICREYGAQGIIYEQMKYCDFWAFERPLASHILTEEYGWPTLSIDRSYSVRNSGQLRTRFQAFVESLEIKAIQKKKKEG